MSLDYDAELVRYAAVLRGAWGVGPRERIVDVGCGTGKATREAAKAARLGSALGVDVSAPALKRARLLAAAEGVGNVRFALADAQTHGFAAGAFDVAVSRFGTMFFADPVAAFANVGRALRAGGRLVMLVWQAGDRNEWDVAIRAALGGGDPIAEAGADPFSLADPAVVREVLGSAGYADVALADVHEPVYYGPDADAALAWVRGFSSTTAVLERLEPAAAEQALGRLRDMLAARRGADGIWFGSRAWLVSARRG